MINKESINMLVCLASLVILSACGGSSGGSEDDGGPVTDDVSPVAAPGAATLIFPEDDTECNTGEVISEIQSRVTFEWNMSANTDLYEISLTNLNSNTTVSSSASTNEATLILERGTPYEWFIISKANGTNETATSTTWRFYNEGPGTQNYAPFPAEAVFPIRGSNIDASTIVLEWSASDVDDDISSFEIFFGTEIGNLVSQGTVQSNTSSEITVQSGTTYYWQIKSIDEEGNSSNSEVFEFRIN